MIRRILTYSAFIMLLPLAAGFSQEKPEGKAQNPAAADVKQQKSTEKESFVDSDGDGIDDRKSGTNEQTSTEPRQRRRQRTRDCFIDNDGDGINDNRSTGVGVSSGTNKGCRWGRK